MTVLIWTVFAYLCGSLPFSVWLGQLALKTDVRHYGDHNPGAFNVMRAGGWQLGMLAAFLDISKGAAPVGLAAHFFGLEGWALVPVALAPVLGHAFSPFLKFQGGKAIAVTGGVWLALIPVQGFVAALIFLTAWYLILTVDGWSVMLALFCFLVFLIWTGQSLPLLVVWGGNAIIVGWKHRNDLAQTPHLRGWLRRLVRL